MQNHSADAKVSGGTSRAEKPIVRDGAYAWSVVVFLTLVYTVSFIDRQVMNLFVDPIRHDLGLTDTQMSLMQGLAFIVTYVSFGPVYGRLADVANRRNLLIFGIVLWSAATVMCGVSKNFLSLFFARSIVGAAEACMTPAVWSMLSDYFTRARLTRAFSVYFMAPYLGGGLALVAGGLLANWSYKFGERWPWLAGLEPWQITFIIVGAPGVVLAVLLLLIVREPPRGGAALGDGDNSQFSVREVLAFMWMRRSFFARIFICMSCICVVLYGFPAWLPSFLIRRHGASASRVGLEYGTVVLSMGVAGVLISPFVVRLIERSGRTGAAMICLGTCSLILAAISAAVPFTWSYQAGLVVGGLAAFFYSMPQAIAATALTSVCPNRMRGVASSLLTFTVSLFGLGVTPTAVALLTDRIFHDPARVGDSLAITCAVAGGLGAILGYGALPHYRKALAEGRG